MAARKTFTAEGVTFRRTIGGYAATIDNGGCFTARRNPDRTWRVTGHYHKAQPLSSLMTLADVVCWVRGHLRGCQGGCTPETGPFDNVKVEPKLSPFDRWMVQRNLEYAKTEGVETVVARLRAQGYDRVASAVQEGAQNDPS
jgi:hypothetical protein